MHFIVSTRGDVLASLRTCPWLSYFAPLALTEVQEPKQTDYKTRKERVRENAAQKDRAGCVISRKLPELHSSFAEKLFQFLKLLA